MPFTPKNEYMKFTWMIISTVNPLSSSVLQMSLCWASDSGWTKQGKPLFAPCWTLTCGSNTQNIPDIFSPKIWATNPLSPEGGVNANIVRIWQGRGAPPGTGWRREIFLILGKHQWSCFWTWLIRGFSLLVSPCFFVFTAGLSSSWGHSIGPLLVVMHSTTWGFITNFKRLILLS